MTPDELLWNRILWHLAELVQEGSLLEVDIEAVSKADFLVAQKTSWVDSEWVLDLTSALLEASQHCLAGLLAELHALESGLYLLLLGSDLLKRVGFSSLFHA